MAPGLPFANLTQRTRMYWEINRIMVRGGLRAVVHRIRRSPRAPGWSLAYESIVEMMTLGTPGGSIQSADEIRRPLDRLTNVTRPIRVERMPVNTALFRGEWVSTRASTHERIILYLHGGGYVSGSPRTHLAVTTRLAHEAQARLFALDYRLAPEHPFPAQIEDAWAAYWWLITEQGCTPAQIVVAGDSAGGGLTMALLLALRDAHVPLPAGGVGLSPWLDLTLSGETLLTNKPTDFLNLDVLRAAARMYCNGYEARHPLISPLYADLSGLPPLLIQAGSAEMLLDDSRRFAERARAAGVDVQLEIWESMVHVWHFTWLIEPKARQAIRRVGRFVRERVAAARRAHALVH
ncbi:MAG: alpha/beta hydrolase [Caldilinea sp.]|nr:alpha/beta hydrolase [Caldilinea sp.]MDW8439873.1 alpha/beta hydrolase [Caldilineaceae bacterium]